MQSKKLLNVYVNSDSGFFSLKEAAKLLSRFLDREISESNISYLINYGKITKNYIDGRLVVDIEELKKYYIMKFSEKRNAFEEKEGKDLNWHLSFDWVKEKERTKHVHRLHPYKGKFIPQLVEYFLDGHINDLKDKVYFEKGDIVLDPFVGSGTTLIQANELGIHSIGVEISEFNALMTEVKFANVDLSALQIEINRIFEVLHSFEVERNVSLLEEELDVKLHEFNDTYFPSPDFKKRFSEDKVSKSYMNEKEKGFNSIYSELFEKYKVDMYPESSQSKGFLGKWLMPNIYKELSSISGIITEIKNEAVKKTIIVIMSRSIHSARATTHMDLDRLKNPVHGPYFCYKHFKICMPVLTLSSFFNRYAKDTIKRLQEYKQLKTDAYQCIITGDSRTVNIFKEVRSISPNFYELLRKQKIKGIFTSPPYVGQLDYHDLHAYAYEFFRMERQDALEIGPASKGKGAEARKHYIEGIVQVLKNVKKYLRDDAHIFIVANDKYELYPEIAEKAGLSIEKQFKRPVLNRTSRDKNPYSEIIFYMRIRDK
jgi:DNA modification methylase